MTARLLTLSLSLGRAFMITYRVITEEIHLFSSFFEENILQVWFL